MKSQVGAWIHQWNINYIIIIIISRGFARKINSPPKENNQEKYLDIKVKGKDQWKIRKETNRNRWLSSNLM